MTAIELPIEQNGPMRRLPLSPGRVERLGFFGTVMACLVLVILTMAEVGYEGDDTAFHVLDVLALIVIGVAATMTHRAFRIQQESQLAASRAIAEAERFRAAQIANLAKSRYLANVSHEIRSPLNAIYGYAQLVERDEGVSAKEAAKVIRRCAEHMTSLVEGLLDVSQVEHGVLRVRSEDVRFGQFLEQIVSMMRPSAAAKGLDFVYAPPARLPEVVRMDPSRLRQVLINLISNAIKYTDRGEVRFAVRYSGQIASFEIVDTGPGIAPEELERVFHPFDRGDDAGKQKMPGAGLGLSISRAIVDILGGTLEVESEPGQGTCFRVRMMLGEVAGSLEKASSPVRHSGYEGARRSILVVDDEAEQRDLLERLLVGLGFAVNAVPNGETALTLAGARRFDLAILDISMPGMSGWEAALGLREMGGPDLRILMLSANASEFHRPEFHHPVHDFFLTKPVDFAVLTETIGGLLELSWKVEQPREDLPHIASPAATSALGQEACDHLDRLRELLRIGYVRGIEAEIRQLGETGGAAQELAARLFGCLDRFDLAGMRRLLEEEVA
ncbi:response regulator [Novosphingobium flavum]|uniref:histidine kinase n=1 Tax=Novosphingobium flavum TaxID=1778672 RepID=A0A7X1FU28_9SPHN|nr:ATP-binding protein [Novosphingobium flavum]MBC2666849.1 response regulator [Novosphingobium flavum]